MTRLFIRMKSPVVRTEEGIDGVVDYLVLDEAGAIEGAGQTDAEGLAPVVETLAPWADDPARVVVLVPVAEVLSASCEVPGRNAAQMRRAVPYAVEEFMAGDIDTMQVACADLVRNEPVRCLVAPRSNVEDWLAFLAAAGIQPGFMTADAMALADDANVVSVLVEADQALVRTAGQMACVDLPNVAQVVGGVLAGSADADEPPVLRLINATQEDLAGSDFEGLEVEEIAVETSVLELLAGGFDARAVNLLQGDYAVKRRPTGAWSRWRPVAAAAAIWFAISLVVLAVQGFWADYKAAQLRGQAIELYRTAYGVDRVVGNPAARMRRLLGQTTGTDTTFYALAGEFGVGLASIPNQFELRGITYSPRRGLDADLILSEDAVLEGLGETLRRQGLEMEVISIDTAEAGGRIEARLRVGGP